MKTKRRTAKGPNIRARESVRDDLIKVGALVKRLILKMQHETFSTQEFSSILYVARTVDQIRARVLV